MSDFEINRTVVVTGDVIMDWNLALENDYKTDPFWKERGETRTYLQRGGAALLADLVVRCAKKVAPAWTVCQTGTPHKPGEVHVRDPNYHHAYTLWTRQTYDKQRPEDKKKAWRVETFLGLDPASKLLPLPENQCVEEDNADACVVVLDDANLGFRYHDALWPLAIKETGKRPWIILKMAQPVAKGDLWERICKNHADRLITVAWIEDLHLSGAIVDRGLSWERSVQDVLWELAGNEEINALALCKHVVISFGSDGALLISRSREGGEQIVKRFLVFDPKGIEGTWRERYPGDTKGSTACLTASLVYQVMCNPQEPNIENGVRLGLAAMRTLHQNGYGRGSADTFQADLKFPHAKIAKDLTGSTDTSAFYVADVTDAVQPIARDGISADSSSFHRPWTILRDSYKDNLYSVAEQVVLKGPDKALKQVPRGEFGKLVTIDRQEIESFRSIRNLVIEYRESPPPHPLSIAVFGPPGSGKSFGVKEVAKSLFPGEIKKREFNLSQFHSRDDLHAAFHEVRDVSLTGKIPLVFWDEFDSEFDAQSYGWLKYFLEPMQDGTFLEGQVSHPIGQSIFVFAGGTCETYFEFEQKMQDERTAKGPDFVSRLKGYIDINGPNPVQERKGSRRKGSRHKGSAPIDPYFIIHRAVMMHSVIKSNAPRLYDSPSGSKMYHNEPQPIESGLLRAFLKIGKYKHGVRSIESIIQSSQLAGKAYFDRADLPPASLMGLHVDAEEFLLLCRER